ncbi:hypothetical protein CMUS01_00110 [Colletotrichum musicola]|uniref:Uncharacterized protein n=1 Tax=Colletotrichum musicola TaxID=2175873 RepID=A0A8H6U969_9PEZI|nr:hypothetical protein CMUS01_00110 [Colletotrichum musicola]
MRRFSTRDKEIPVAGKSLRKPGSFGCIHQLLLDVVLALPAGCFIVYAIIVLVNNGLPLDQDPIPALQTAAKYSPTVFPIAFAAVAANLLKAAAGRKLEQGISLLNLEYLLRCRTVFSAITTPLSLRSANMLTPALLLLWALSPLGGQAALRVMEVVPSTAAESWPYQLLNYTSEFPHTGSDTSAGYTTVSRIQSAFVTALSSPGNVKSAARDLFGNIKVPMVEYYQAADQIPEIDGWYHVDSTSDIFPVWSSIAGIPVAAPGGIPKGWNYSFEFETSYMSANCSLQSISRPGPIYNWYKNTSNITRSWNNRRSFAIRTEPGAFIMHLTGRPLQFEVGSWGHDRLTNATCFLKQVYVEVAVGCHGPQCAAVRVRQIPKSTNDTARTVLHGSRPANMLEAYMSTFILAGLSLYDLQKDRHPKPYASAIETYFTDPDTPYSAIGISSREGTDVYPIGEVAYSQRLSQLLNTFWLASVASRNITGTFNFRANSTHQYLGMDSLVVVQNITGMRVPDQLVMRVHPGWLFTLCLASTGMLLSGIAAVVFDSLRRGPDILDYSAFFSRDSPYVNAASSQHGSVEDVNQQVRRNRHMRVCVGDVNPTGDMGHLGFATLDKAIPVGAQKAERVYD